MELELGLQYLFTYCAIIMPVYISLSNISLINSMHSSVSLTDLENLGLNSFYLLSIRGNRMGFTCSTSSPYMFMKATMFLIHSLASRHIHGVSMEIKSQTIHH